MCDDNKAFEMLSRKDLAVLFTILELRNTPIHASEVKTFRKSTDFEALKWS